MLEFPPSNIDDQLIPPPVNDGMYSHYTIFIEIPEQEVFVETFSRIFRVHCVLLHTVDLKLQ